MEERENQDLVSPNQDKALIRAQKEEVKRAAEKQEKKAKRLDNLKILLAIIVVIAGIGAQNIALNVPAYIKTIFPFVGFIIALLIVFFWCSIGPRLILYIKNSIKEFKKVVWPTRQIAIRTTVFVIIFIAIFTVFIYGVDSIIIWLFNKVLVRS